MNVKKIESQSHAIECCLQLHSPDMNAQQRELLARVAAICIENYVLSVVQLADRRLYACCQQKLKAYRRQYVACQLPLCWNIRLRWAAFHLDSYAAYCHRSILKFH